MRYRREAISHRAVAVGRGAPMMGARAHRVEGDGRASVAGGQGCRTSLLQDKMQLFEMGRPAAVKPEGALMRRAVPLGILEIVWKERGVEAVEEVEELDGAGERRRARQHDGAFRLPHDSDHRHAPLRLAVLEVVRLVRDHHLEVARAEVVGELGHQVVRHNRDGAGYHRILAAMRVTRSPVSLPTPPV